MIVLIVFTVRKAMTPLSHSIHVNLFKMFYFDLTQMVFFFDKLENVTSSFLGARLYHFAEGRNDRLLESKNWLRLDFLKRRISSFVIAS
jgi:hypothetical protein